MEILMYPDHPEANKRGCKCPAIAANNKGEGTLIDGVRSWTVSPQCPLHADPRWWGKKPPAAS